MLWIFRGYCIHLRDKHAFLVRSVSRVCFCLLSSGLLSFFLGVVNYYYCLNKYTARGLDCLWQLAKLRRWAAVGTGVGVCACMDTGTGMDVLMDICSCGSNF